MSDSARISIGISIEHMDAITNLRDSLDKLSDAYRTFLGINKGFMAETKAARDIFLNIGDATNSTRVEVANLTATLTKLGTAFSESSDSSKRMMSSLGANEEIVKSIGVAFNKMAKELGSGMAVSEEELLDFNGSYGSFLKKLETITGVSADNIEQTMSAMLANPKGMTTFLDRMAMMVKIAQQFRKTAPSDVTKASGFGNWNKAGVKHYREAAPGEAIDFSNLLSASKNKGPNMSDAEKAANTALSESIASVLVMKPEIEAFANDGTKAILKFGDTWTIADGEVSDAAIALSNDILKSSTALTEFANSATASGNRVESAASGVSQAVQHSADVAIEAAADQVRAAETASNAAVEAAADQTKAADKAANAATEAAAEETKAATKVADAVDESAKETAQSKAKEADSVERSSGEIIEAMNKVVSKMEEIASVLGNMEEEGIYQFSERLINKLDEIAAAFTDLKTRLGKAYDALVTMSNAFAASIKAAIVEAFSGIGPIIEKAFSGVGKIISDAFKDVKVSVSSSVAKTADAVDSAAKKQAESAKKSVQSIINDEEIFARTYQEIDAKIEALQARRAAAKGPGSKAIKKEIDEEIAALESLRAEYQAIQASGAPMANAVYDVKTRKVRMLPTPTTEKGRVDAYNAQVESDNRLRMAQQKMNEDAAEAAARVLRDAEEEKIRATEAAARERQRVDQDVNQAADAAYQRDVEEFEAAQREKTRIANEQAEERRKAEEKALALAREVADVNKRIAAHRATIANAGNGSAIQGIGEISAEVMGALDEKTRARLEAQRLFSFRRENVPSWAKNESFLGQMGSGKGATGLNNALAGVEQRRAESSSQYRSGMVRNAEEEIALIRKRKQELPGLIAIHEQLIEAETDPAQISIHQEIIAEYKKELEYGTARLEQLEATLKVQRSIAEGGLAIGPDGQRGYRSGPGRNKQVVPPALLERAHAMGTYFADVADRHPYVGKRVVDITNAYQVQRAGTAGMALRNEHPLEQAAMVQRLIRKADGTDTKTIKELLPEGASKPIISLNHAVETASKGVQRLTALEVMAIREEERLAPVIKEVTAEYAARGLTISEATAKTLAGQRLEAKGFAAVGEASTKAKNAEAARAKATERYSDTHLNALFDVQEEALNLASTMERGAQRATVAMRGLDITIESGRDGLIEMANAARDSDRAIVATGRKLTISSLLGGRGRQSERESSIAIARQRTTQYGRPGNVIRFTPQEIHGLRQQEYDALFKATENRMQEFIARMQDGAFMASLHVKKAIGGVVSVISSTVSLVAGPAKKIADAIVAPINGVIGAVSSAAKKISSSLVQMMVSAPKAIGQLGKAALSGFIAGLRTSNIEIKRLSIGERIKEQERALDAVFRAGFRLKMVGMDMQFFGRRVTGVIDEVVNLYGNFELTTMRAAAALGGFGIALNDATLNQDQRIAKIDENFSALKESILDAAESIGFFTSDEVAKGLYFYASTVGQNITAVDGLRDAMYALEPMMKVAAITGTGYESVIKGVFSVVSQFNSELVTSAKITGDYTAMTNRMADVTEKLYYVANATASEFPDLINAFKMVGPVAKQSGASFEDMVDILGRLADIGIKGTMAGRGMRQMFIQMARPTPKAKKAIEDLFQQMSTPQTDSSGLLRAAPAPQFAGKTYEDVFFPGGKFQGVDVYIKSLAEALQFADDATKNFTLSSIATANELPIITALVNDQIDSLNGLGATNEDVGRLSDKATGKIREQWNAIETSTAYTMARLDRVIETLKITIGDSVSDGLLPFINQISDAVKGLRTWVEANQDLVKNVGAAIGIIGGLSVAFGSVLMVMGSLVGLLAAAKLVFTAFAPVFGILGGSIGAVIAFAIAMSQRFDEVQEHAQKLQANIVNVSSAIHDNSNAIISMLQDAFSPLLYIGNSLVDMIISLIDILTSSSNTVESTTSSFSTLSTIVKLIATYFSVSLIYNVLKFFKIVAAGKAILSGAIIVFNAIRLALSLFALGAGSASLVFTRATDVVRASLAKLAVGIKAAFLSNPVGILLVAITTFAEFAMPFFDSLNQSTEKFTDNLKKTADEFGSLGNAAVQASLKVANSYEEIAITGSGKGPMQVSAPENLNQNLRGLLASLDPNNTGLGQYAPTMEDLMYQLAGNLSFTNSLTGETVSRQYFDIDKIIEFIDSMGLTEEESVRLKSEIDTFFKLNADRIAAINEESASNLGPQAAKAFLDSVQSSANQFSDDMIRSVGVSDIDYTEMYKKIAIQLASYMPGTDIIPIADEIARQAAKAGNMLTPEMLVSIMENTVGKEWQAAWTGLSGETFSTQTIIRILGLEPVYQTTFDENQIFQSQKALMLSYFEDINAKIKAGQISEEEVKRLISGSAIIEYSNNIPLTVTGGLVNWLDEHRNDADVSAAWEELMTSLGKTAPGLLEDVNSEEVIADYLVPVENQFKSINNSLKSISFQKKLKAILEIQDPYTTLASSLEAMATAQDVVANVSVAVNTMADSISSWLLVPGEEIVTQVLMKGDQTTEQYKSTLSEARIALLEIARKMQNEGLTFDDEMMKQLLAAAQAVADGMDDPEFYTKMEEIFGNAGNNVVENTKSALDAMRERFSSLTDEFKNERLHIDSVLETINGIMNAGYTYNGIKVGNLSQSDIDKGLGGFLGSLTQEQRDAIGATEEFINEYRARSKDFDRAWYLAVSQIKLMPLKAQDAVDQINTSNSLWQNIHIPGAAEQANDKIRNRIKNLLMSPWLMVDVMAQEITSVLPAAEKSFKSFDKSLTDYDAGAGNVIARLNALANRKVLGRLEELRMALNSAMPEAVSVAAGGLDSGMLPGQITLAYEAMGGLIHSMTDAEREGLQITDEAIALYKSSLPGFEAGWDRIKKAITIPASFDEKLSEVRRLIDETVQKLKMAKFGTEGLVKILEILNGKRINMTDVSKNMSSWLLSGSVSYGDEIDYTALAKEMKRFTKETLDFWKITEQDIQDLMDFSPEFKRAWLDNPIQPEVFVRPSVEWTNGIAYQVGDLEKEMMVLGRLIDNNSGLAPLLSRLESWLGIDIFGQNVRERYAKWKQRQKDFADALAFTSGMWVPVLDWWAVHMRGLNIIEEKAQRTKDKMSQLTQDTTSFMPLPASSLADAKSRLAEYTRLLIESVLGKGNAKTGWDQAAINKYWQGIFDAIFNKDEVRQATIAKGEELLRAIRTQTLRDGFGGDFVTNVIDNVMNSVDSRNPMSAIEAGNKIADIFAGYIPDGSSLTLRELWNRGEDLGNYLAVEAEASIVQSYFDTQVDIGRWKPAETPAEKMSRAMINDTITSVYDALTDRSTWRDAIAEANKKGSVVQNVKEVLKSARSLSGLVRNQAGSMAAYTQPVIDMMDSLLPFMQFKDKRVKRLILRNIKNQIRGQKPIVRSLVKSALQSWVAQDVITPEQLYKIFPELRPKGGDTVTPVESDLAGDIFSDPIVNALLDAQNNTTVITTAYNLGEVVANEVIRGFGDSFVTDSSLFPQPPAYTLNGVTLATGDGQIPPRWRHGEMPGTNFPYNDKIDVGTFRYDVASGELVNQYDTNKNIPTGRKGARKNNPANRVYHSTPINIDLVGTGVTSKGIKPVFDSYHYKPQNLDLLDNKPANNAWKTATKNRGMLAAHRNAFMIPVIMQIPPSNKAKVMSTLDTWGDKIKRGATGIGNAWGLEFDRAAVDGVNNALLIMKASLVGSSPPKKGPLRTIDKGGHNIGKSWGGAFHDAAVDSIHRGAREVRRTLDAQNNEFASRGALDMSLTHNSKKQIQISLNVTGDGSANRATMSELRKGLMDALIMADLEHMVEVI